MKRLPWILSRVAAALVGTIGVSLVVAWAMVGTGYLFCDPSCGIVAFAHGVTNCSAYTADCGDWVSGMIFTPIPVSYFAIPLGILPGIAALTLTPAKAHPWRALLILVPATALGAAIWLIAFLTGPLTPPPALAPALGFGTMFLLPTITGLLAAFNIKRLPVRYGFA